VSRCPLIFQLVLSFGPSLFSPRSIIEAPTPAGVGVDGYKSAPEGAGGKV
jgi:hypothetical protein